MAANIDTMLYVGEKPWHGLGIHLDETPESASEIIESGGLGWTVNSTPLKSDLHERVLNYHAIYREDNNEILGVVNKSRPILVQNEGMFNSVDQLLNDSIDFETAASLGLGETVFGCFKIRDQYKVFDDEIDHYFVVVNDHLKVDGKITVLNTPIRVVCQNTLAAAMHEAYYKMRLPVSFEAGVNTTLSRNLIYSVKSACDDLKNRAQQMYDAKIDKKYVERLLDYMFPYQKEDETVKLSKSNEKIALLREQFISNCLGADNLTNYAGTQWQVFNAVADWQDHYFRNADKAYDLKNRMKSIPGVIPLAEVPKSVQYMKIRNKIAA